MPKIAYLLGGLERGGTETLLLDTIKQVQHHGIDCIVIHRKKGSLLPDYHRTGVPLYFCPTRFPFDPGYLLRLRSLVLRHNIELIHAQLPYDAFLAYWACLGTGIPLILTFHGYENGYNKLARLMVGFAIRHMDLNIFVSHHLLTHYTSVYSLKDAAKQQVVYNGVDFTKFDIAAKSDIRKELALTSTTLLIGSIGNFVLGRDQLTICRFLAELKKNKIDFCFIFVGARSEYVPIFYDECIGFCKEYGLLSNVYFLGSRNDVPAILQEMDAFIYASDHDSFGIAVVEAMASGLPVFVNDWAVMKEITNNGQFATLYKTKDINNLISIFLSFIENKLLFQEQAVVNITHIRNLYSIQQHVESLHKIYQSILHAGH